MATTVRNYIPLLDVVNSNITNSTEDEGLNRPLSSATATPLSTPTLVPRRDSPISVQSLLSPSEDDDLHHGTEHLLPSMVPVSWFESCEPGTFAGDVKFECDADEDMGLQRALHDTLPPPTVRSEEQNSALCLQAPLKTLEESRNKTNDHGNSTKLAKMSPNFTKRCPADVEIPEEGIDRSSSGLVDFNLEVLCALPPSISDSNLKFLNEFKSSTTYHSERHSIIENVSSPSCHVPSLPSPQTKTEVTLCSDQVEVVPDAKVVRENCKKRDSAPLKRSSSRRGKRATGKRISKREAAKAATAAAKALQDEIAFLANTKQITDEELLQLKPKKKRRSAKFENPIPSRFCHICSRTPKNVRLAVCSQILAGTCRKVVCEKCFGDYGFGNFADALNVRTSTWACPHCCEDCPPRAQCSTYGRINDRLRVNRLKQERPSRSAEPEDHSPGQTGLPPELEDAHGCEGSARNKGDTCGGIKTGDLPLISGDTVLEIDNGGAILHQEKNGGTLHVPSHPVNGEMEIMLSYGSSSQATSPITDMASTIVMEATGSETPRFASPVSVVQSPPVLDHNQEILEVQIGHVDMEVLPEVAPQGTEFDWPGVTDMSSNEILSPSDSMRIERPSALSIPTSPSADARYSCTTMAGIRTDLGVWADLKIGTHNEEHVDHQESTGEAPLPPIGAVSNPCLERCGSGNMETDFFKSPSPSEDNGVIDIPKMNLETDATEERELIQGGTVEKEVVSEPLFFEIDGLCNELVTEPVAPDPKELEDTEQGSETDFTAMFD